MGWKFWKKDVAEPKKQIKQVDGWELKIVYKDRQFSSLTNTDIKPLWKIYHWYLTKDSEKYNIKHNSGMYILDRWNVKEMYLNETKITDIWSKDDETKD